MTRKERARLRELAQNWIHRVELGGDSVTAVERDTKSLTALLVRVAEAANGEIEAVLDQEEK